MPVPDEKEGVCPPVPRSENGAELAKLLREIEEEAISPPPGPKDGPRSETA